MEEASKKFSEITILRVMLRKKFQNTTGQSQTSFSG
jgi:hypothetical protein